MQEIVKVDGPRNSGLGANDSVHLPEVSGVWLELTYVTLNVGAARHKDRRKVDDKSPKLFARNLRKIARIYLQLLQTPCTTI